MISRRHLADRNFRNYGCHDNRVKKCPSFIDPIDDGERLVRRPPRRTPEQETTLRQTMMTDAYRDNVDVAKRSGILKQPSSTNESLRMVRDPRNQPCQFGPGEPARWNAGRNLRWSEEDMERTGLIGGARRPDTMDDFKDELSHLARIQEELRKTVQNRKSRCLASEALVTESRLNCKLNPEVQSCPDIPFVVDEFPKHDRDHTLVRLSGSGEAVQSHRHQTQDAMTQHPSRVDCHKRPPFVCTAQEGQLSRCRVRGRSLDHFEQNPKAQQQVSVPSRSLSRTRKSESGREVVGSASAAGRRGSNDGRGRSVCQCGCCGVVAMESPDSRRERLLMQERCDSRVWQELRSLLQAVPTTDERQPLRNYASKSSSSDETINSRHRSIGKTGQGRGAGSRGAASPLNDKMTQTEASCRNLRVGVQRLGRRTPSIDRLHNHRGRRSCEDVESRSSVDKGCQATVADRGDELDAHICDSSITEITSIWPSTSGSGTQDGTSGGAAATASSTTDATTSCQSQESLSLLQSISAELLGSSVSSECLRAAIDATTGGQPLDENSVLEAIDREMADVNQFVRETLDVSEIKPKEYLQMHMRNLQKFTSNLEEFISQQKPIMTSESYGALSDSAFTGMQQLQVSARART